MEDLTDSNAGIQCDFTGILWHSSWKAHIVYVGVIYLAWGEN